MLIEDARQLKTNCRIDRGLVMDYIDYVYGCLEREEEYLTQEEYYEMLEVMKE